MGKKKKGGKKKKKKGAGGSYSGGGGRFARPTGVDQVIPGRGHHWPSPTSLPAWRTSEACTCYRNIIQTDGQYVPHTCSQHEDTLSHMPMRRLMPQGTSMAVAHTCERQILLRTNSGVAVPNGSNPSTAFNAPWSFVEKQLKDYTSLLANSWGEKLLDSDRAEVLVRKATLLQALSRQEEALTAADKAIGLRPRFPQAYFVAGQAAFALGKFDVSCDRFREGLHEAPNRKELQTGFRVALLEANKRDSSGL